MAIPDYDDLVLERAKAINLVLPQISIKGTATTVNVKKEIHSGSVSFNTFPLVYSVVLTSTPLLRGTSITGMILDVETWCITSALQSDQEDSDGSKAMQDASAAKYVLLNHYVQRPMWHIDDDNRTPLLYLIERESITISATSFTRGLEPKSPQYAGARMVQRLRFTGSG